MTKQIERIARRLLFALRSGDKIKIDRNALALEFALGMWTEVEP